MPRVSRQRRERQQPRRAHQQGPRAADANEAPAQPESPARRRLQLISELEAALGSKVVTYFLSDRTGATAVIAQDAVRPLYDHLLSVGHTDRIDLFLFSVGGHTEVPWRIVPMIREFSPRFNVLIPFRAMSAATLIALGADQIVMGRKGELGPVDPTLSFQRGRESQTVFQEEIAVEDIMSYIRFLRERSGVREDTDLIGPIAALADKIDPWVLGQLNRAHSHIRAVAAKLLSVHNNEHQLDPANSAAIVETLTEKTYQHGHAIGRKEAADLKLEIVDPDDQVESLMWKLYLEYESVCATQDPIDPRAFIPRDEDEYEESVLMGAIESVAMAHHFDAVLKGKRKRQPLQNVNLNFNFNLQLPPGMSAAGLAAPSQQAINNLLQQIQQQAQPQIVQQLEKQMPEVSLEIWSQEGAWRPVEDWGH